MSRSLTIQQGSTADLTIRLFDPNGDPEDLTGATAANLTVRTLLDDDTTEELARSTTAGTLSVDIAGSKLVASLNQAEADALRPGDYAGQASVEIGGAWLVTRQFDVRILPKGVPTS